MPVTLSLLLLSASVLLLFARPEAGTGAEIKDRNELDKITFSREMIPQSEDSVFQKGSVFREGRFDLPVLSVVTEKEGIPGDEGEKGILRIYEMDTEGEPGITMESPVEISIRGNTSRYFPKKSYRMKLLNKSGQKRNRSIAGLRSDDDWILNPMYSDTSKIREAVSYWLWDEVNSKGRYARSSRVQFGELWMNGQYWGLYGIQERIDRKQVGADRQMGILYKVRTNDRPSVEELLRCEDPERCHGIELVFAGSAVTSPWLPAADYIALLEGRDPPGNSRLSPENVVDYALWATLVQARDGHFKNQFIHCVWTGEGYELYRIPWDLNHTLGDLWNGDSAETNFLEYDITNLALDDIMDKMIIGDDAMLHEAIRTRWEELRKGGLSENRILSMADELFERLYLAILRDSERWPACGMGDGNATNIRDIEDFVRVMLRRMDGWTASLS